MIFLYLACFVLFVVLLDKLIDFSMELNIPGMILLLITTGLVVAVLIDWPLTSAVRHVIMYLQSIS